MTRKQPKGTVVVCSHRGMLRLRLPRHLFNGAQKYLYLSLPDTPLNRQAAQFKADAIASDIAFDRFDLTLIKYQPSYISKVEESMNLVQLWDLYSAFKERSLSVTTINKDFKRIHNHIAKLPFQDLKDARKIRNYLLEALSIESSKRVMMQINACCNWAVEEELIATNPFAKMPGIKGRRKSKSINPFTQEEQDRIITTFESHPTWCRYHRFVKFLFFTGCRPSEAVGLRWEHIDEELTTITFSEAVVEGRRKDTKTHTIRKFPINKKLRELLADLKPEKPLPKSPVFCEGSRREIDLHYFRTQFWKEVLQMLRIDYRSPYHTRHTFITNCLEKKVPVTQVAQWVGNSAKTIWTHYAGLTSEMEVPE